METGSHSSRVGLGPLCSRFRFRHLLVLTLGLVAATIVLGVAAKATGSGLACEARWPRCDGGPFNLFPASLPSFYEWIHRFVAMFAGFGIVGSALAAWRLPSVGRRVTGLVLAGALLTPVQVYLGRATVFQYRMGILSLHFWTAILIFSTFLVATVLVRSPALSAGHVTAALGLGVAVLPVHVALSPVEWGLVSTYSPTVQLLQYAVTLLLLAAVIVAAMGARARFEGRRLAALLAVAGALALVVAYLGRRTVMTVSPVLDVLYLGAAGALLLAFLLGLRWSRAASRSPLPGPN
jgi:cytochrome c oxidase assembly protein subunit 15